MKITKSQLKQIIKEEVASVLSEEARSSKDIVQQLSKMAGEDYLTLMDVAGQSEMEGQQLYSPEEVRAAQAKKEKLMMEIFVEFLTILVKPLHMH